MKPLSFEEYKDKFPHVKMERSYDGFSYGLMIEGFTYAAHSPDQKMRGRVSSQTPTRTLRASRQ